MKKEVLELEWKSTKTEKINKQRKSIKPNMVSGKNQITLTAFSLTN